MAINLQRVWHWLIAETCPSCIPIQDFRLRLMKPITYHEKDVLVVIMGCGSL